MRAAVDIWWMRGAIAEPAHAAVSVRDMTAIPPAWRRGRRGRFLGDVLRQYRAAQQAPTARAAAGGWRFNLPGGRHLSLTDTGPILIVALAQGTPIGIDAERARPVDDAVATLQRLALGRLADRIGRLEPQARARAFAHVWTAFEAFLKLERLGWDEAARRFADLVERWRIGRDGTARFEPGAQFPLNFQPVDVIPGVLLTVASPVACRVSAAEWHCGTVASPVEKSGSASKPELRGCFSRM